jgi:hypothetical protein
MPRRAADAPIHQLTCCTVSPASIRISTVVPGGKLGDLYGRRRLFSLGLLNLPIGLGALAVVHRLTNELREPTASGLPDGLGAAASATLVLALSQDPPGTGGSRFLVGPVVWSALEDEGQERL